MATGLSPLAKQRREVTRVACHQNPTLLRGERKHLRIVQRTQRRVGCEADHVVAALGKRDADALR